MCVCVQARRQTSMFFVCAYTVCANFRSWFLTGNVAWHRFTSHFGTLGLVQNTLLYLECSWARVFADVSFPSTQTSRSSPCLSAGPRSLCSDIFDHFFFVIAFEENKNLPAITAHSHFLRLSVALRWVGRFSRRLLYPSPAQLAAQQGWCSYNLHVKTDCMRLRVMNVRFSDGRHLGSNLHVS